MKHVVVIIASWLIGCSSASTCDLSTEAGIAAAFKKATGKELSSKNRCSRASKTFPGLAWVGMFADDRGCIGQGILVGCQLAPPGYEAAAMAKAGWATADLATRQKLAVAWLSEIDDLDIVHSKPKNFPKEFSPVSAKADGNKLVLEFWTVASAGMEPGQVYNKHQIVFGPDGVPGESTEIDHVEDRTR